MRRIFLVIALLLVIALISGGIYWYFFLSKNPTSEISPGTKPTPGVGFRTLNPYAKLCASFQKIKYEISCEKAVSLALEKAKGEVQKVSTGSAKTVIRDSNSHKIGYVDVWLIDIKLKQPQYDKNFKKEVTVLRIGIGLHQHWGFYTEVLE